MGNVPPLATVGLRQSRDPHSEIKNIQLLRDAYLQGQWVGSTSFVLIIGGLILAGKNTEPVTGSMGAKSISFLVGSILLMFILNFVILWNSTKKFALATSRTEGYAIGAALVLTLISPGCFGMISFLILAAHCVGELSNYGIRTKMAGVKKKDIEARIDELRKEMAAQQPSTAPPPRL